MVILTADIGVSEVVLGRHVYISKAIDLLADEDTY